jgi:hypothetical protein
MAGRLDGLWPVPAAEIRAELVSYLAAASDPSVREMPTLCPAWTVRQVTMHLAATFDRFGHPIQDHLRLSRRRTKPGQAGIRCSNPGESCKYATTNAALPDPRRTLICTATRRGQNHRS